MNIEQEKNKDAIKMAWAKLEQRVRVIKQGGGKSRFDSAQGVLIVELEDKKVEVIPHGVVGDQLGKSFTANEADHDKTWRALVVISGLSEHHRPWVHGVDQSSVES